MLALTMDDDAFHLGNQVISRTVVGIAGVAGREHGQGKYYATSQPLSVSQGYATVKKAASTAASTRRSTLCTPCDDSS